MEQSIQHGILNVYHNGDTDGRFPCPTYADPEGQVLNPKDIVLDNNGRAIVYVDAEYCYRLEVFDKDKSLLWTTSDIQPPNKIAIDGTYTLSINGDDDISVTKEVVDKNIDFNLSLTEHARNAIDGFYDETIGNNALYNDITDLQIELRDETENRRFADMTLTNITEELRQSIENEATTRQYEDTNLSNRVVAAKTEVEAGSNITVTNRTATDGHTIYTVNGVPNVSITSQDNSITVTPSTIGSIKTFDLSVNPPLIEWIEATGSTSSIIAHTGVPISLTKQNGSMSISSGKVQSLNGIYHATIQVAYERTTADDFYNNLSIEILNNGSVIKSFDCVVDSSLSSEKQYFEFSFDAQFNGTYGLQYRTGGLSGSFNLSTYIHKIQVGGGGTGGGSSNGNPLLVTSNLQNENGNLDFTGACWGSPTGGWNTYGINNTTRYYRITSYKEGTVSRAKIWNYNGNGRVRICLMELNGTIKAQSPWTEITSKGIIELSMTPESGQTAQILPDTDYWIGICAYGLQFCAFTKYGMPTSFNDSTLRYAVCIRNGAQFPQTGTGWDNPLTDNVNSIPQAVPSVYLLSN